MVLKWACHEESTVKDQAACPIACVIPDDDEGNLKQARKAYSAWLPEARSKRRIG